MHDGDARSYQFSRMSGHPGSGEFDGSGAALDASGAGYAFRNSSMMRSSNLMRHSDSGGPAHEVFVRGSLLDRDIEAVDIASAGKEVERARDYKGRRKIWPGMLLLVVLVAAAAYLITSTAMDVSDKAAVREKVYAQKQSESLDIGGGASDTTVGDDIVSDDGAVGNPKSYPKSACEQPDYQSKNGHIVAVSANGTEVPLKIKGINWFGMETGQAAPFGLWANSENGTSVYHLAKFLAKNKFNAVRLPLMASWILENKEPNVALINKQENRAVSTKNYMSLLKGIIKALQFRNIGVLLSMHTLTYTDNGALWYNADVTEDDFLKAVGILTENLCSYEYWNIMGVDLKNEPYKGTWGDGGDTDFAAGATRIANHMLEGCSNWMGFVEGINGAHTVDIDGTDFDYSDWYGGGLQGAKELQVEFDVANKVVWAPHYYTPAVYPQMYLYGGGTLGDGGAISDYIELDDDALRHRIKITMDDMFGFLASETGAALLLGEFGGLYARDEHPMKTTKRCTDFTLEIIKQPGWAGGFVWSLNPESAYQFNPADKPGTFTEGVLNDDWLSANEDFLVGMAAFDDMENLQQFPCFPYDAPSESASASASASASGSA